MLCKVVQCDRFDLMEILRVSMVLYYGVVEMASMIDPNRFGRSAKHGSVEELRVMAAVNCQVVLTLVDDTAAGFE